MSKKESISRYNLIIKKVRKYPASFEEIMEYLELESEIQGYNFIVSKRTFQRDLNDIRSIFNIDIKCHPSTKKYYIEYEETEVSNRLLEAFDVFNALNITDRITNYIHFEKRKPQGTENLYGLIHAIKNKFQIKFKYQKYWEDEITERKVEPYALKEFKNRWYVLALDLKDTNIKSFALDRLTDFEITKRKFQNSFQFNIKEYYKNCFGIMSANDKKPQEVILSFDPNQGKYIKSLPLHESQHVLIDNSDELRIKVNIFITHDFFMEILSHGEYVKVIKPESLINDIKNSYKKSLGKY